MTILYPTQQKVLNEAESSFLYELGTSSGKTLISIYHYLKHSNGEPLLIIMPPAKLKTGEWIDEIKVVEQAENITIEFEQLRSEEHTSELQSRGHLVCRLLLEKKKL